MAPDGSQPSSPEVVSQHSTQRLTMIVEREGDEYVALCPELDLATQGDSVESSRLRLSDAVELFFECASADEVSRRLSRNTSVVPVRRSELSSVETDL